MVMFLFSFFSTIMFIVALIKISNILKILEGIDKKIIIKSYADYYNDGEMCEYIGKGGLALENYMKAHFTISKIKNLTEADKNNKKEIENKILALGGKI